jgi:hypothetical protein
VEEDKHEDEGDEDMMNGVSSKKTLLKASNAHNDRRSMSMLSPHEQDNYNKMTFGDDDIKNGGGNKEEGMKF